MNRAGRTMQNNTTQHFWNLILEGQMCVSHITQFLQDNIALLMKTFSVGPKVCYQKKSITNQ